MKLYELINYIPFYEKHKEGKMPIFLAYKLAKIYRQAKQEEEFYRNKLQEILREYAELDENGNFIPTEDGNGIKVKPETQVECMQKINELSELKVAPEFEMLSINEFGTDVELTPIELEAIMPFIKE